MMALPSHTACRLRPLTGLVLLALWAALPAFASGLDDDLGRAETRVLSAAYPFSPGTTVEASGLLRRLERLGYRRVHEKPTEPGTYFYGHETFWIYRNAYRERGRDHGASVIGIALRRTDGRFIGAVADSGESLDLEDASFRLEPETLSESLDGNRADRVSVSFDEMPELVWRTVLAAEDARFFDHIGVDARSIARAALANLQKGEVVQGGSTITQQLIKNRDLTPKQSMGRKASEAARALMLEIHYDKQEILESYLNQVYLGNVDGLAVHGIGTASRVYFSKPLASLNLAEAATLAAMIQGPNRLSPLRHPERVRERRDWVLSRVEELGWADARSVAAAERSELRVTITPPTRSAPVHFLSWISSEVEDEVPERLRKGRGVVVETTLDPYLQELAQAAVKERLDWVRRTRSRLRNAPLSAALVALDARTGEVLAYVGGDPSEGGDRFDRARLARRQPGSSVKPFVMLEAFEHCGERRPLHPASRIADKPLTIDLPSGAWSPENYDRKYRGTVTARATLADSLNVPTVRVARWCGFDATATLFARLGFSLPPDPPPSFVLGALETTPLEMARAYTVFATPGKVRTPLAIRRLEKPEGKKLARTRPREQKVVRAEAAYLVRDVLKTAVLGGTAKAGRLEGIDTAAKTGSSSGLRDAWFCGHAGSLVTVVWVGLDDSSLLGLTGSSVAGPLWHDFMKTAVLARPGLDQDLPKGIVEEWIDPGSGLLVSPRNKRAEKELFRRGALPPRNRFWRIDSSVPVVD
jgi:penicillin-binding protein 1B